MRSIPMVCFKYSSKDSFSRSLSSVAPVYWGLSPGSMYLSCSHMTCCQQVVVSCIIILTSEYGLAEKLLWSAACRASFRYFRIGSCFSRGTFLDWTGFLSQCIRAIKNQPSLWASIWCEYKYRRHTDPAIAFFGWDPNCYVFFCSDENPMAESAAYIS